MKRVLSWTFLGLMLFPSAVWADETNGSAGSAGSAGVMPDQFSSGSSAGSLVWVIVALLLVIGLIVLFIKFLSARNRNWGVNRSLRSLGGVTLGQNKSLQLVEAAGRIYVVGVGDEVTLIDKITDPDTAAAVIEIMEDQAAKSWNPATVAQLWSKVRNRGGKTDPGSESWDASSFQQLLNENLDRQSDRKSRMETILGESKSRDRSEE